MSDPIAQAARAWYAHRDDINAAAALLDTLAADACSGSSPRAQEPLVMPLPRPESDEDSPGVGEHTPTPQPLSDAQLQAIDRRASTVHAWLKFAQRLQTGDDWLPLSVRRHFNRDVPQLLAAAHRATEDASTTLTGTDMTVSQQARPDTGIIGEACWLNNHDACVSTVATPCGCGCHWEAAR